MYTSEEVEYLIENYDETEECIDRLAEQLGKSRRSIIGKCSRLNIYKKKVYLTKRGQNPVTKAELVHKLAVCWDLDLAKLEGLEKCPKDVLQLILDKTC